MQMNQEESLLFFEDYSPHGVSWSEVHQKHFSGEQDDIYPDLSLFNRGNDLDSPLPIPSPQEQDLTKHSESEQTKQENSVKQSTSPKKQKRGIDYEKNICAYVSKRVVQSFIDPKSKNQLERLCSKENCDYHQTINYYKSREKEVFGVGHLGLLLTPVREEEVPIKKVFFLFMRWFLRNKYMLYVVKNGKMDDKETYIEFKNRYILYIEEISYRAF